MWTALYLLLVLTPDERRAHERSFQVVWETVRAQHWDVKQVGKNWDKERRARLKQIAKAADADQIRRITQAMLDSLGQSHFQVIPGRYYRKLTPLRSKQAKAGASAAAPLEPETVQPEEEEERGEAGVTGAVLDFVEQRPTVVEVEPDSPAATAGVKPGWILLQAGALDVAAYFAEPPPAEIREKSRYRKAVLASLLSGPLDEPVDATFASNDGGRRQLTLGRRPPRGNTIRFGNFPEERVWIDTTPLAPGVGRLRFNAFMDPERLMPAIESAVKACSGCRGFVIDVRGNPGGLAAMAMGVAGWFTRETGQKLGTLRARDHTEEFEIRRRARPFNGPLAILVDGGSASTAEILAGGLQDSRRARLFGERTAGAALPSHMMRLPNGDGFQYATATYVSQSGRVLEGQGVTPDEIAPQTRAALAAGGDAALDAALRWLLQSGQKEP